MSCTRSSYFTIVNYRTQICKYIYPFCKALNPAHAQFWPPVHQNTFGVPCYLLFQLLYLTAIWPLAPCAARMLIIELIETG